MSERLTVHKNLVRWIAVVASSAIALSLAGCTAQELRGYLPSDGETTNNTSRVIGLWSTSWIVLLAVGVLTWGLIIWAAISYRRRQSDTGLPSQLRYNLPIETFFTVVPLILIIGFFAFTARNDSIIEKANPNPDYTIQVFGKRWAWDFNYINDGVYESGIQAQLNDSNNVDITSLPVLYLPVGKTIEFDLESRDVNHSFWIVDFLYKKDMLPGQTNHWYVTPEKEGTFRGKCAELCGEYHSLMLFTVKVVSQSEFDAYIQSLRDAGQVGQLGADLNTNNDGTTEG
jgi:cytochrome c oxidase subunit 2